MFSYILTAMISGSIGVLIMAFITGASRNNIYEECTYNRKEV